MIDIPVLSSIVFGLALPYASVLVVPGPNLLLVTRASIYSSRRFPANVVLGIASGATLAAAIGGSGAALFPAGQIAEIIGTFIFAALLIKAAIGLIFTSRRGADLSTRPAELERRTAFLTGLFTALFNPVSISFFGALFLHHPDLRTGSSMIIACFVIFFMASAWFAIVGTLLAVPRCRRYVTSAGSLLPYTVAVALVVCAMSTLAHLKIL
ncbi:MAG TPA: LysE family transporter [Stellaceae bacterium]|nr:LysE family transporter [Stellaceae bacterium]